MPSWHTLRQVGVHQPSVTWAATPRRTRTIQPRVPISRAPARLPATSPWGTIPQAHPTFWTPDKAAQLAQLASSHGHKSPNRTCLIATSKTPRSCAPNWGTFAPRIRAPFSRKTGIFKPKEEHLGRRGSPSFRPAVSRVVCRAVRMLTTCRSGEVTSWANQTSPAEALRLIPLHYWTSDCRSHRTFLMRSPLTLASEALRDFQRFHPISSLAFEVRHVLYTSGLA